MTAGSKFSTPARTRRFTTTGKPRPPLCQPSKRPMRPAIPIRGWGRRSIPAGTQFQISLGNDTTTGSVSAFSCTVFDGSGTTLASLTKKLKSLKGGSAKNLAPITAFELDIVGPDNGAGTVFTNGADTIQYSADNQLFVSDVIPGCSGATTQYTEEISNARYAAIPANQSFAFSQKFSIVGTANP
jgi:hypothetical protein